MNTDEFQRNNENLNELYNDYNNNHEKSSIVNKNENKNLHLYKKNSNSENIYETKSFFIKKYNNLSKKMDSDKKKNSCEEENNKIICSDEKYFLNNKSDELHNVYELKNNEIKIDNDLKRRFENILIFRKDKNVNSNESIEIKRKKILKKKKDPKVKSEKEYSNENTYNGILFNNYKNENENVFIEYNDINKDNITYNSQKFKKEDYAKDVITQNILNEENKNKLNQKQVENLKELKEDRVLKKKKKDNNCSLIKTLNNTKSILMHTNQNALNISESKIGKKGSCLENLNINDNYFFLKYENNINKGRPFQEEMVLPHNLNENEFIINFNDIYNLNVNKNPSLLFIINGISETIKNIMDVDKSNNKNKMKLIEIVENINLLMQSYYNIIIKCDVNLSFTIKRIRDLYKSYKEVDIFLKKLKKNKILFEKSEEKQYQEKNSIENISSLLERKNPIEGKLFINSSFYNNNSANDNAINTTTNISNNTTTDTTNTTTNTGNNTTTDTTTNFMEKENNLDDNINTNEDNNKSQYENCIDGNNNNNYSCTIEKEKETHHYEIMKEESIENKNMHKKDNKILENGSNNNVINSDSQMNLLNVNNKTTNTDIVLNEPYMQDETKNNNEEIAQVCKVLDSDKSIFSLINTNEKCTSNFMNKNEKLENGLSKDYNNNNNNFKNFTSIDSKSTAFSNHEESSLQFNNKNEKMKVIRKKKKILKELEKLNSRFFFIFNHKGVIINYLLKEINECLLDFDKNYQLYISH